MWKYIQASGQLEDPTGKVIATGYSGHGPGRNSPAMQNVHDIGPIPVGTFHIGAAEDSKQLGPVAMPLTQLAGDTFGRSGFFIHGDDLQHDASHGCVILPHDVRLEINKSNDKMLIVC